MRAEEQVPTVPRTPRCGWVQTHGQVAGWLTGLGLTRADDYLQLPGEVVSGHVSRHVMHVRLGVRSCYLKREHAIRWRDQWSSWWAGFGWVSKSEREGRVLWQLEHAVLPAPRCLAFGQDGRGRAFLLVEEAVGAVDLRQLLARAPETREAVAERLGHAVAQIHGLGFDHPDLFAKHVLVCPDTLAITLLDWQRSQRFERLDWGRRLRSLAALRATLADELVPAAVWSHCLETYWQTACATGKPPPLGEIARRVERDSRTLLRRPGVRDQRRPRPVPDQRLVWLDGEGLCATPQVAAELDPPAARERLYDPHHDGRLLALGGGRRGRLSVGRTSLTLGRLGCAVRGQPWRSPELRQSRLLFHLERHNVPAPRLLAFGQRRRGWLGAVESFLLTNAGARGVPLRLWWDGCCRAETPIAHAHRRRALAAVAELLRRLHDAGCTVDRLGPGAEPFAMHQGSSGWQLRLEDTSRVRYRRHVGPAEALADLRRLWRLCRDRVSRTDWMRFLVHYARAQAEPASVRLLLEGV